MKYQILHDLTPEYIESLKARFWAKVDTSGGPYACWEWTAYRHPNGYGSIIVNRASGGQRHHPAHRVAYELAVGPIPKDKILCHKCDNRACVNLDHIFVGTYKDNCHDMIRKGRAASVVGQNNGNAKLTRSDVKRIRRIYQKGVYGCKRIAKQYGVHYATIHLIVTRQSWSHI